MATHAIGKLKFNLSKQGLAYRWGDGEIHRFFGGKAQAGDDADVPENDTLPEDEYDEGQDYADDPGYDDGDYQDDPGYDDGEYTDDPGYDDGDYQDDPGYDDGQDYEDDAGYDDGQDYEDDPGYDDGEYQDDGYDDGYYDEDGEYDDRYSDEDAGDGYAEDEGYASESPLMQYVDDNDWVTYVLLFLFPPLGIYLLWRRNKFEKPVRYAVSAASAIWFIVALILIFSGIFGGRKDEPQEPTITLMPSTTGSVLDLDGSDGAGLDITVSKLGDIGDITDDGSTGASSGGASATATATVAPSPTPLTGSTGTGASTGTTTSNSAYVYSPATGLYYHSKSDCTNIDEGVSVSRVPREVAENNRKQTACPVCIGAATGGDTTTYYATTGGSYYHKDQYCQGMTDASPYTKEAAEARGKLPCPVCVTGTQQSLKTGDVKFITDKTTDKSKISVYYTKSGKYYHMTSNCSGMSGASRASLKDALLAGKSACPTCCKAAGTSVYCTSGGKFYHTDKTCSGMTGAAEVTLAEALVMGKTRCHTCVKSGSLPTASQLQQAANAGDDGTYVWGTPNGKYYHTRENCSGMKDAQRYTLKSMLLQKRQPCPVCASAADTVVYATEKGQYYHSYSSCSGMGGAKSISMAEAISQGKKRCPRCWSESTSMAGAKAQSDGSEASDSDTAAATAISAKATAKNTYVYATQAGSYYHLKSNCSGMKGASRITLKQAIEAGKSACPTCAGSSRRKVYSNKGGKNYHSASSCSQSGMKNGQERTLAEALMMGQTACKYCWGKSSSSSGSGSSSKTSSGSSSSKTSSSAKTTASGKTDSSSSKTTATQTLSAKTQESIKKAAAKLTNSHTYKNGTSGIKVYARADGKYYHRKSDCSGMTGASHISLETAMNYGKTACPKCCGSAKRTVYATRGGKYYHNSKTHAGTGAKTGTLASALAYGYVACPYCVTKTKTVAHTDTYKSGTSGIKVYATVSGKYFHSKSDCSDMKNASRVSLETAMNYGKKPCPKCMAAAGKKVYSSSGDKYYHYYKAHAGSGASAGTLAKARALGKKLCPTCARGFETSNGVSEGTGISTKGGVSYSKAKTSDVKYAASGDTDVYVDLSSKSYYYYYHKSSRCSDTHMKDGTPITLEYAKDFGYKACPYCNPPTSVS